MKHSAALRAIAHHEAGHATALWFYRHPIVLASIVPQPDYGGVVRSGRTPRREAQQLFTERAIVAAAGAAAQRLYAPRTARWCMSVGDVSNLDEATTAFFLTRQRVDPVEIQRTRYRRLIEREARGLVRRNWLHVHRIAAALLEEREISGFAIDRICHEASAEWSQVSRYYPGLVSLDYVRREIAAAKPPPRLTRAALGAATLRAAAAGAPDLRAAVLADMAARGFPEPDCRALWDRAAAHGDRDAA